MVCGTVISACEQDGFWMEALQVMDGSLPMPHIDPYCKTCVSIQMHSIVFFVLDLCTAMSAILQVMHRTVQCVKVVSLPEGMLKSTMELNLVCCNAAVSACDKGSASMRQQPENPTTGPKRGRPTDSVLDRCSATENRIHQVLDRGLLPCPYMATGGQNSQ